MNGAALERSAARSERPAVDAGADVATVLALTDQVEAAIEAGEWQHAADLEAERRAVLVRLVERQAAATSISPELRDAIADLASRTYRLIGLAQHHQRSLLRDASMVRLGRRAADEYGQNAV